MSIILEKTIDKPKGYLQKYGELTILDWSHPIIAKNGRARSKIAIKLHDLIGGEENYYTGVFISNRKGKYNINVDIAFPLEKIAIEYDGSYWHNNIDSQLKDMEQTSILISNGWKILRIKSRNSLPQLDEINLKLEELRKGACFRIIYYR